jgi:hypothetical protein
VQSGTSFWFYTWQDCDLIYSTRTPLDKYCSTDGKDCSLWKGDRSEMVPALKAMGEAYATFASKNEVWQQEFAAGHCKLNNLGALYGKKKACLCSVQPALPNLRILLCITCLQCSHHCELRLCTSPV